MKLTVLGKYGPYPLKGGACSGYLIEDDNTKLLVDIGPGVFARLMEVMNPEELDGIIISHFHFDHSSDMGVLRYYLSSKGKQLNLVVPNEPKDKMKEYNGSTFIITTISKNSELKFNNLTLKFYETVHPIKTFGIGFFKNNRKILHYTSDTKLFDSLSHDIGGAKYILGEAGCLRQTDLSSQLHIYVGDLIRIAKENNSKLLLTHFNEEDEVVEEIVNNKDIVVVKERETYILR